MRLFGTNVGNASHYKKKLVVDPNGQVSVSYLDQEGRVIATALAGVSPDNVDPLESYTSLDLSPVTEKIGDKNRLEDGKSITRHRFLNVAPNTAYTFRYDLSAMASEVEEIGCQSCAFDLVITLTDPDGGLLVLPDEIPGTQSTDSLHYRRFNIKAECNSPLAINDILFDVTLADIGDYTITKTLIPHEMSFAEMRAVLEQDSATQVLMQEIRDSYVADPTECEICTETCDEAEAYIEEAIDEIAALDCENILRQIEQYYLDQHPDSAGYTPTQQQISSHPLYCKYLLCVKNQESDAFDKRQARVQSWSAAVTGGKSNPVETDPFFNNASLSGYTHKSGMQNMLNNTSLGTIGSTTYTGTILQVTDPANTDFYVNGNGEHDAVNGKHILYLNLMSRRSELGETVYQSELDQQRWIMYRGMYEEAKRQMKLSIAEYQACPSAMEELQPYSDLASYSEEDVKQWGNANGMKDSVSVEELEMSLYSITDACNTTLSPSDSTTVMNHLKAYFDSNRQNLLRIIQTEDVATDAHLSAINGVLSGYNCALDSVALVNMMSCVRDTTITIPKNILYPSQGQGMQSATVSLESLSSVSGKANAVDRVHGQKNDDGKRVQLEEAKARQDSIAVWIRQEIDKRTKSRILADIESSDRKLSDIELSNDSKQISPMSTGLPSQAEYDALIALYYATNDFTDTVGMQWERTDWINRTGWKDADPEVVQDVSGWYGVTTDANGHVTQLSLANNRLKGILPVAIGNLSYLEGLILYSNQLTGQIPASLGNLTSLFYLSIGFNQFTDSIPSELGQLANLQLLSLTENQLSGKIPPSLGNLTNLFWLEVSYNQLWGEIPSSLGNTNLSRLYLDNNGLRGSVPQSLTSLNLTDLWIQHNKLSGMFPLGVLKSNVTRVSCDNNNFTFSDLLPAFSEYYYDGSSGSFVPQDSIDLERRISLTTQSITFTTSIDRNAVPKCKYQWFKYVNGIIDTPVTSQDTSSHTFTIVSPTYADIGKYYYTIINDNPISGGTNFSQLKLYSHLQTVDTAGYKSFVLCFRYDSTNATLQRFTYNVNLNDLIQQCMERAAQEDSILTEYAINRLLQERATAFYSEFKTKCMENVDENLEYTYISREYHYTLYYYDQSANLVQTVPPAGVHPLTPEQLEDFESIHIAPGHLLITRYQYNSLNQLIWQQTPDAGESLFWYNDKGQLRLSQNAQQRVDTLYSYTKYDEQGRITEVGELSTGLELEELTTKTDSLHWPIGNGYVLSDITRTHYDFGRASVQGDFPQNYLRTRVSWVEVIDKNSVDTISTYYSYDVHGNVRSLQQRIPNLDAKRTDYVYDLVSGKVNYVMYQFDRPDQFIHRYDYDADNRITSVFTSTDGFIWDQDASYRYYAHGPLARVGLGEHRVQGLDYYYTLQGWIKGVNMPYAGDPGGDGITSVSGRDVFAYSLGYYTQDYKPINNSVALSDSRDQLWPRLNEVHGHSGLYNGNITWMVTDLSKIGEVNNDRAKGMQGMVYKYDQLHRITKSRSLTEYNAVNGFAFRDGSPHAYDEDYTYDPNGNLLTLNRKDPHGYVLHNFEYGYYPNTNKLRQVGSPEDMVYSGALSSNTKLYRKITLQGNAYVPQGKPVELRALEEIEMDPDFEAADGTDFFAHIVADSGMYQYDKIGNLVFDQHEGVKISWTPYGKVREVRSKSDSLITTFRYDGAGDRIEKKVARKDSVDIVLVTHYVLDASGNVMGVYTDNLMTEQYVYGSSRLGLYRGGRYNGQQSLGEKQYELSNHLGNVLAVVTDNIGMSTSDSVWASVVSTRDYYPFGLEMEGRVWSDTTSTYRYGFNGKEKDENGEWGNTAYDYGFRIYDPVIARFKSVDPLTKSYPWYTPYQFAGNTPIMAIDLDGLEPVVIIGGADLNRTGLSETILTLEKDVKVYTKANGLDDSKVKAFNTDPLFLGAVKTQIKNFITENYSEDTPLIIYGYSLGGVLAQNIVNELKDENPELRIDLLVTIDPALSKASQPLEIPSNVKRNVNVYQTDESSIYSRGYPNYAEDSNKTTINNIDFTGQVTNKPEAAHGAIDEKTQEIVKDVITKKLDDGKKTD